MPAVGRSLSEAHSRTLPPGRSLSDTGSQTFSVRTVGCWQVRCSLVVSGIRFWLKAVLGSKLCFAQHLDRRAAMAHPECCEPCEFLPIYGQLPDFLTHESYYGDMGFRCVLCNTWCQANQPCDVRDDPHLKSEAHFKKMGRWLFAHYKEDYPYLTWANLLCCFDKQDLLPSSWAPLCEKYAKQQEKQEEWEAEEARRKSNPNANVDPQGNSAESWHVSHAAASDAGWRDWKYKHLVRS